MEDIQTLIEKIRADIQEGKSDKEIFQFIAPFFGKDAQRDGTLAELLASVPHTEIAKLLHRMLEATQEKKVQKIIKRSLYRLKSKGIVLEEDSSNKRQSILRPLQAEPPKGFGNGIDFLGDRVLLLVVPYPGRGWIVINGVINDEEGLMDVFRGEVNRKEFWGLFEEMKKNSPTPFVEIEPSYVGFLLTWACQLTLEKGRTLPQYYLDSKSEIQKIKKDYERPLVYSLIEPDAMVETNGLLRKGGELLKADVFDGWRIKGDLIQSYADEVWEAEESKILLNPAQKEVRFQGIYQKALSELFTEERRRIYQKRLEEMAYLLFKLGRMEEGKICLSVAIDLEKPLNVIQPSPFLFQLVTQSIFGLLAEAYEKKSNEISLIVKP